MEKNNNLFESEEENENVNEGLIVSYTNRKIHLSRYDRMVKDVVVSLNENEYVLDPDFQRNFVWDDEKCSKLIESIIINVPIPSIYAADEDGCQWIIVDGVQRLTSLQKFYNNKLKLSKLEILTELNGKTYGELDDKYRKNLDKGNLSIILLDNDTATDIKFDIFMRLNTGGEPLTAQELRNCLYRGALNDCIKNTLAKYERFRILLNAENKYYKRLEDVELVLRFIALYDDFDFKNFKFENYNGRLKSYLNNYMEKHKNVTNDEISLYKELFFNTIDKIYKIYGKNAFIGNKNSFNKSIYDTMMLTFSNISIETFDIEKIKCKTNELFKNEDFIETLNRGTTSNNNIVYRINELRKIISESNINDKI